MLRMITGKARSGKTAAINREIQRAVQQKQGNRILLVPEQYSHELRENCVRYAGMHFLFMQRF